MSAIMKPSSDPSLSQDLKSLSVSVTELPSSVTDLVDCVAHEIGVIETELNHAYDERKESKNDDEQELESLEDAIDDGFMCVDLKVLERKLEVWHELFSPNNNKAEFNYTVTPFFAVKCNPDTLVVEWLARSSLVRNLPLGFDCASITELELAKKNISKYSLSSVDGNGKSTKVPTTRIVYANPQRAEADLIQAMELFASTKGEPTADLWLTLDGVEEIYKIAIAKERFQVKHAGSNLEMPTIKIILRIWVPDGHSQVPLGEKFGMRLDQIDGLVEACLDHNIVAEDIIGISFHCGSGCSTVETYLDALAMGKTALEKMDKKLLAHSEDTTSPHRCWLMDMGGGFPGIDGLYGDVGRFAAKSAMASAKEEKNKGDEEPTTTVADIAGTVRSVLQSYSQGSSTNPPLTLIAEPGRYFVEGAFALASRIYQKQVLEEEEANKQIRVYRIPHGVQGVFKDVLLCGESFVPQPLQLQNVESQPTLYESKILGPSGDDSEDVVCGSCMLPELAIGDWLVFDRMGAYTLSIASRAGRPVMRYVMGGGNAVGVDTE
mmetsp:Transcript_8572/g.17807  ORF Transcript_8572/g.17807 Transcript_8572/m.17807 type:complete len:549 (-) Transcript_8572:55-1701(-)